MTQAEVSLVAERRATVTDPDYENDNRFSRLRIDLSFYQNNIIL